MIPRRHLLYAAMLLAVLLGGLLLSHQRLAKAHRAALAAAEDFGQCQRLVHRLEVLSRKPALAGDAEPQLVELTRRIEQAAEAALLAPNTLQRITPEAPRRLGDSVYKEKPTQLLLRQVSLRQLTTFLHGLAAQDAGLEVRSVRLSASREQETADVWSAEVTVAYLIYAPPTTAVGRLRP